MKGKLVPKSSERRPGPAKTAASQPPASVQCRDSADGGKVLEAELQPGLYAFTVEADASRFNWNELYITFNIYGNVNQRTGPWDFNELENNRPVMPAYWVSLDGRKMGLWYFNRLSSEHVAERRCRGELCFRITSAGRHKLEFKPYRAFQIEWAQVELQPEPFDRFDPIPRLAPDLIGKLLPETMPSNRFTQGFLNSVTFAKQQVSTRRNSGFQLPILAAAWRWSHDAEALTAARQVIEAYLALPVWGNPREDGYGHNGDMATATPLFGIAVALRWLGEEMADLRERILGKLQKQGDTFLEMALLHRGYWGGSILQDHGFVSFAWFACAAYCLHDILPAARDWLAFAIPRFKRSLAAIPRDGMVPCTSYHRIWMYVDKLVLIRELHRLATGEDIYERDGIRAIPFAARSCFVPERSGFAFPSPYADLGYFDGAQAFLAQMAHDEDAQWLLQQFFTEQNLKRQRPPYNEWHFQKDWLWALLFAQPTSRPCSQPFRSNLVHRVGDVSAVTTQWFRDSGVGVVRAGSSLVVTHCGPPNSQTSYDNTTCCCDRLITAPLSGNFVYMHQGRRVLHTAEGGYRQRTAIGNVLLVDGHGQKGDIGMPMSYPDFKYHGEKILDATNTGVRMDLAPAYERLVEYTRRVGLTPAGGLEVEDTVQPTGAHTLSWRFQTYRRNPWTQVRNGVWHLLVDGQCYEAHVVLDGSDFTEHVGETTTVWGYVNENEDQTCHHLAIEAVKPAGPVVLRLTLAPLS